MPREHGRTISQDQHLGDDVVVARTLAANAVTSGAFASGGINAGMLSPYAVGSGYVASGALGANTLRMYAANASCPDQSSVAISHNLGAPPLIVIRTNLSHASGQTVAGQANWVLGPTNNSQAVLEPIMSSGFVPVSGLPVHVAFIAP